MKIVAVDNFDTESVADYLVAENLRSEKYAAVMCEALNKKFSGANAPRHFQVWPDDRRLSRGMEDLV